MLAESPVTMRSKLWARLPCVMITPLGSDVDPLVNWRKAGESEDDDDDDESDDAGSDDAGVLSLSQAAAAAKDSDDREAIYLFICSSGFF